MVEVFKTNVGTQEQANRLIDRIHQTFRDYKANFDLDDCDKILRVERKSGVIHSTIVIQFLRQSGFHAEVLPDDDHLIAKKGYATDIISSSIQLKYN
jgi:hypothetical protein